MTDSVKAMLQTLIDADVKSTGEVTQGTLDAIRRRALSFPTTGRCNGPRHSRKNRRHGMGLTAS